MKKYSNNEITITWEPEKCIHSRKCFTSLIDVFNPGNRPWININGADSESIIKAIDNCPSKALGYLKNNEQPT